MDTLVLKDVEKAASLLKEGALVAIPTETVYGLAAPIFLQSSLEKIFQVKGRPSDNPLIIHIASLEQVEEIAKEIPHAFYLLAEAFFPGPLTIILKKKDCVPSIVSADLPTIGVRMPQHPMTLKLIKEVKIPLAAPSANLSGRPSSTTALHVLEDFEGKIEAVLDGGSCQQGIESTVLILEPRPIILRPGSISKEHIEKVLGQNVEYAPLQMDKPLCPGMKYRHYSPKGKILLFHSKSELERHLALPSTFKRCILTSLTPQNLYSSLRDADNKDIEEIAILLNESIKSHPGLMNRLLRASS